MPIAGARYRNRFTVQARRPSCHITEHLDRAAHVAFTGVGHGLAVVEGLKFRKLVDVLLEKVAYAPDKARSFGGRHSRPGAGFKSAPRRRDGKVDIGLITGRRMRDDLFGCRILDWKSLAAFRGDPFSVDEKLEFLG